MAWGGKFDGGIGGVCIDRCGGLAYVALLDVVLLTDVASLYTEVDGSALAWPTFVRASPVTGGPPRESSLKGGLDSEERPSASQLLYCND